MVCKETIAVDKEHNSPTQFFFVTQKISACYLEWWVKLYISCFQKSGKKFKTELLFLKVKLGGNGII